MKHNIHLLTQSDHLRYLFSLIRDKNVSNSNFVFYSNQVIRKTLEAAVNILPYESTNTVTPIGATYEGKTIKEKLCAISIIRAGESMESEVRLMFKSIPFGKVLIQRNKETKLPKLYYSNLPDDISERSIFLLEPMLATGGSALMAIEVLLSAGAKESNIIFINLLASPEGIKRVSEKYPDIHIVTASIEEGLNENAFMIPGIGDFGDRYFGTIDSGAI